MHGYMVHVHYDKQSSSHQVNRFCDAATPYCGATSSIPDTDVKVMLKLLQLFIRIVPQIIVGKRSAMT